MSIQRSIARFVVCLFLFAPLALSTGSVGAQLRYSSGQNVAPVYEGWEKNADGTFTMYFGYMNRNYEEEPFVPIGADNSFEPGPADRGQPTHFYPRRQQFVFQVVVPANWGEKKLIWALTNNGRTDKAYGALMPVWQVSEDVISNNRGGSGGNTQYATNNPPSITVEGPTVLKISTSDIATLTVSVTDDGLPPAPPSRGGGGRAGGAGRGGRAGTQRQVDPDAAPARGSTGPLGQAVVKPPPPGQRPGVTWVLYRGEPKVTFSEMRPKVTAGKATTTARFGAPGTYVLRAYADDGVRTTPADVTVTVIDSAGATGAR